jgi:hypothetical protein
MLCTRLPGRTCVEKCLDFLLASSVETFCWRPASRLLAGVQRQALSLSESPLCSLFRPPSLYFGKMLKEKSRCYSLSWASGRSSPPPTPRHARGCQGGLASRRAWTSCWRLALRLLAGVQRQSLLSSESHSCSRSQPPSMDFCKMLKEKSRCFLLSCASGCSSWPPTPCRARGCGGGLAWRSAWTSCWRPGSRLLAGIQRQASSLSESPSCSCFRPPSMAFCKVEREVALLLVELRFRS